MPLAVCLDGKGILVVTGRDVTVQDIEFANARNGTDGSAAGIRQQGAGLTVRGCRFDDNDNGIVCDAAAGSTVSIDSSEFDRNGAGDGHSHNILIGAVESLSLKYCWVHGANGGCEVKTAAKASTILYNRIGNEGGTGTYEIQAARGGTTYIIGNQIEQSAGGANAVVIDYGSEGLSPDMHLYVVSNTIVNNKPSGTFIHNGGATGALLQNNIFQGPGTVLAGPGTHTTNWATAQANLAEPGTYDFRLTADSMGALNGGTAAASVNSFSLAAACQYVHPCGYESRPISSAIDIGAYEYTGVVSARTVQFAQAASSASESVTPVNLAVTLSTASTQTVKVSYAVTGGTATGGGVDYTLAAGQLVFDAGVTGMNIPITIINDSLAEPSETIVVTLSDPVGATLGANSTHTCTITDDDAAAPVGLTATADAWIFGAVRARTTARPIRWSSRAIPATTSARSC